MPRRMVYDRWLFFTVGLLVVAGVLIVGSASPYQALRTGVTPQTYLFKQLVHALVGAVGLLLALMVPYRRLADGKVVLLLVLTSVVGLTAVLLAPPTGSTHRWLRLGDLSLQPSEFAKLAMIVFTAYMLSRKHERVNEPWAVPVPCMVVVGGVAFLTAIEPDLGSAVMLAMIPCLMLFVAGVRWRLIAAGAVVGLLAFVFGVVTEPYRIERLKSYLRPGADALGSDYQLFQSMVALGSGGITGVGPGQGQQKAFFLPEPHTDFIFSVVGEELGLVGTLVLLSAFLLLFWRGMRTALRAPDRFGFFLALGITSLLVLQALINMGVCLGLLPTKGLPLPLISYGGSSLVASMIGTGILLNISQYSR